MTERPDLEALADELRVVIEPGTYPEADEALTAILAYVAEVEERLRLQIIMHQADLDQRGVVEARVAELEADLAEANERAASASEFHRLAEQSVDYWRGRVEGATRERDEWKQTATRASKAEAHWRSLYGKAFNDADEWQRYAETLREALGDLIVQSDLPSVWKQADEALALPAPGALGEFLPPPMGAKRPWPAPPEEKP